MTTREQNIALIRRYQLAKRNADSVTARHVATDIIAANEGLVRRLASRYARPQTDEDLRDAMQAARMGILRSLVDFDPELGSFSTHAGNHIRDYVQRFAGKTAAVVRPRSSCMPASVATAAAKFRMVFGREPTAQDLGVPDARWAEWSSGTHLVDIDDTDEDRPRLELTYNQDEADHAGRTLALEGAWREALEDLSPRNREICERVLLNGEESAAVGRAYGLSHARILQVCKRIECRLRRALNPDAANETDESDWDEASRRRARESSSAMRVAAKVAS